jgi:serine/threonine-protein kinase
MAHDLFSIAGTTQGAFKVEKVVAEGGFGVVYRAYHGGFRAPVALKCLKMPAAMSPEAQEEFIEHFRAEAAVLFRLSSSIPAVVRPLHADVLFTSTGAIVPFIALEWLDGETLAAHIASRTAAGLAPFQIVSATRLLTPVARALDAAHRFPGPDGPICVVHRDIKPANIFLANVNGERVVKILDFGIARVRGVASVEAGLSSATGGPVAFTPGYASPEQWLPKRFGSTGPWTDVWGLALTLVELVVGHPPLEGDVPAIMGTALDDKRRPTPRSEGVAVSDAVEDVLRRALAVDPRDRQKDAGVLWDELETALGVRRSSSPSLQQDILRSDPPPANHVIRPLTPQSADPFAHEPTAPAGQAPQPEPKATRQGSDMRLLPVPDLVVPPPRGRTPLSLPRPEPPGPRGRMPLSLPRVESRTPATTPSAVDARQTQPWSPRPTAVGAPSPRPPARSRPSLGDPPGDAPRSDAQPVPISVNWDAGPGGSRPAPERTPPHLHEASGGALWKKLGGPIRLAAAGALIAALDRTAGWAIGERITLGPIRLFWVAAAMALVGLCVALWRVFWPSSD